MSDDVADGAATTDLSLRGFFLSGIQLVHNRLQILGTEFADEKTRLTLTAITGIASLFFLGLAVVLITLLLVTFFWASHPVLLLSVLSCLFALLGGGLLVLTLRSMSGDAHPFQATLDELEKDEDAWRTEQGGR